MGVRLTVNESAWRDHVTSTAAALPGLLPVVKGNGYGFGRAVLARLAVDLLAADTLVVGTVHEVDAVPDDVTALVLTPTVSTVPDRDGTILTVGSAHHVDVLAQAGWTGPVVVKLLGSMRRYGTDDPVTLADACRAVGLTPVALGLHLPLAGTADDLRAEVEGWLDRLEGHLVDLPVHVSHLDATTYAHLRAAHPTRSLAIRTGTALWHGARSTLHLGAEVVDVHAVRAGDVAGYRATTVPVDGHLVLVSAGSAHGVAPLEGGISPFHFARRRLAMLEPPHMHTSMVLVPGDDPCPTPGDLVDLQRPLTTTLVDEVVWT